FHSINRLGFVGSTQQLFPDLGPVLLQVVRKFLHGHAVDSRASFITLDSRQCLLTVFCLADFLHELIGTSRTFRLVLHHRRFGPSPGTLRSLLLPVSGKASACCSWFFCRLSSLSCTAYSSLSLSSFRRTVWAFSHRSRLSLAVAPPFGFGVPP